MARITFHLHDPLIPWALFTKGIWGAPFSVPRFVAEKRGLFPALRFTIMFFFPGGRRDADEGSLGGSLSAPLACPYGFPFAGRKASRSRLAMESFNFSHLPSLADFFFHFSRCSPLGFNVTPGGPHRPSFFPSILSLA